jgi:type II secretory pathway pseudopilin PulG
MYNRINIIILKGEYIMHKNSKGITLVALIITVVIMLILAGFVIDISMDLIDKSNLEDIKTNMLAIQGRARIIKEKHDFDGTPLIGTSTANGHQWSKDELVSEGLGNIPTDVASGEYYAVDYDNDCEVYYSLGVNVNGTTKYKLSEIIEE